jgi:hypothetical protein
MKNYKFSQCDQFIGSSTYFVGTHCWMWTPRAVSQSNLQSCQSPFWPVQFDFSPPRQLENLAKCLTRAVNHTHANSVLTAVTSRHHAKVSLLCQVINPSLLAAGWSADHKEVTTFLDQWPQGCMTPQCQMVFGNKVWPAVHKKAVAVWIIGILAELAFIFQCTKAWHHQIHSQSDLVTCQWSRNLTSLQV